MSSKTEQVLQTALLLPSVEQIEMIEMLIAAQDEADPQALGDAWMKEIQRRSAEFDAGNITPIPWSAVRDRGAAGMARMVNVSFQLREAFSMPRIRQLPRERRRVWPVRRRSA